MGTIQQAIQEEIHQAMQMKFLNSFFVLSIILVNVIDFGKSKHFLIETGDPMPSLKNYHGDYSVFRPATTTRRNNIQQHAGPFRPKVTTTTTNTPPIQVHPNHNG